MTDINQTDFSNDEIIQIMRKNCEETIKLIEEKYEYLLASKEKRLAEQQKEIDYLREKVLMLDNIKINIPLRQMNIVAHQTNQNDQ
jgi:hypothetical protein